MFFATLYNQIAKSRNRPSAKQLIPLLTVPVPHRGSDALFVIVRFPLREGVKKIIEVLCPVFNLVKLSAWEKNNKEAVLLCHFGGLLCKANYLSFHLFFSFGETMKSSAHIAGRSVSFVNFSRTSRRCTSRGKNKRSALLSRVYCQLWCTV